MPQLPQSQYPEETVPPPSASAQVPTDERDTSSRGRERNVRPEDQLHFKYAEVLVSKVLSEADPTILAKDLPNFHHDDPIIVRWPVLHLRIVSNDAILGHLYKAFEDAGTRVAPTGKVKKKRAYNSVKRTKPNPEVLLQKKLNQKKMAMCTPEKINECLRFTCTYSRECMRKVDKKDVLDERSFFYNEPYSRRVEYILSKFDHPGFANGYMLFRTLEVCKKTFWTLYGFVKKPSTTTKERTRWVRELVFTVTTKNLFVTCLFGEEQGFRERW
ncbi:hypothetical protein R1sor_012633 [Riccia sorocarpa]|uniref:Transposase n=1 Tax=Riccia sorocarpa TaxID=122646 RepID=A0ABD3I6Z5_9MARC